MIIIHVLKNKSTVYFKHRKSDHREDEVKYIELQHSLLTESRLLKKCTEKAIEVIYWIYRKNTDYVTDLMLCFYLIHFPM